MAQYTDLYSLLMTYANKRHSPYIHIDTFVEFLEKYAGVHADESPEWKKWTSDASVKFWNELNHLVEDKKCALPEDGGKGRIYLTRFYTELLNQAYRSPDTDAALPFPDEHSLQITIPGEEVLIIKIEADLTDYLQDSPEPSRPIIKITFPERLPPALILSSLVPRRLMEMALLKIRYYLQNDNNREYFLHKLIPQFTGKETLLREMFKQLETNPMDCLRYLETGGEFAVLFWLYFCNIVKAETRRKEELLVEDIAVFQSVFIVNVMTVYYKKAVMLAKEKELAFLSLEQRFNKAPYLYSINDIIKFTGTNGQSLLGQYSREELEEYLTRKTTEHVNQELPELLIFHDKKDEQFFIEKSKVLSLYTKLLADVRSQVQKAISLRWQTMLREFHRENAMEQDQDFDKLVESYVIQFSPVIGILTGDKRLYLVYVEIERSQGPGPESSMLFSRAGVLIPFSTLLVLKRKELLADARLVLPFWYSIPVFIAIISFFKRMGGKKKARPPDGEQGGEAGAGQTETSDRAQWQALHSAAREYKSSVIPLGYTLDTYLADLENRWRKLLDQEDKKILVEDVKSLVRDRLRRTLRQRKYKRISPKTFAVIADGIMMEHPTLERLDSRESIHLYIELYIIKLIENIKM
jgi:hypothetical protein